MGIVATLQLSEVIRMAVLTPVDSLFFLEFFHDILLISILNSQLYDILEGYSRTK